jgi:hypothetical protein
VSTLPLALLTVIAGAQAAPNAPAGWVVRPLPPDRSAEWSCATRGPDDWMVSTEQGRLTIVKATPGRPGVTLPFTPEPAPGEAPNTFRGLSAVRPVADGFLAGFDRGESGGRLYWFSQDGSQRAPISAMSASWFPENVVDIVQYERTFFVFQGLAHQAVRRGRVLKVQQAAGHGWVATVSADLGTTPKAVLEESPGSWLVATSDGVKRFRAQGTVDSLWESKQLASLAPTSIVRANDGVVYLGMRTWVLRLKPASSGPPVVELLAPSSCARFDGKDADSCRCAGVPEATAGSAAERPHH